MVRDVRVLVKYLNTVLYVLYQHRNFSLKLKHACVDHCRLRKQTSSVHTGCDLESGNGG